MSLNRGNELIVMLFSYSFYSVNMCGIAGFYSKKEKDEAVSILRHMLTRIKYRGPDQSGIYVSKDIGLGSVRLSIIDLQTGGMPLSNEDETLWIVFNGEIFNYIELKSVLLEKGHHFKTTSDTEVILHLYEEYGSECLNMLNGQFAIAIWNTKTKELFLARDRVGIRPLFYSKTNEGVVFASEIKAILEYPRIMARISAKGLSQVFTFWTTISPNTIFQDIYEVPPGHYITVNESGVHQGKYWELPVCKQDEYRNISLNEAIEEFSDLFSDAVRIRMRADVPIGAYLSGGIDSSITTSYIKNIIPDNLRTFSIGFTDDEFDETFYQDLAVDYFKTEHARIICSSEDIAEKFPAVVWHSETPLLRTAPTPMHLLSGLVRSQNVKVVITGEGADELLGGYNIFKEAIIREFWAKDPKSKYRPLLLKKLYPYLPHMKVANGAALKMFFGYKLEETDSPVYSHLLRWNNTSRIKNYLSEDLQKEIADYDPVDELAAKLEDKFKGVDLLSRAQWLEVSLFMSGYLLSSQGDRMAMANSVEGRYPFLDYRLMEFCMKLPPDYKL
ncbi:MAG TPA: asparagine synthase (glutamine-hydrolyzing), partial [Paludibacter sp.]|nr:asparagine synthase (glutamine-hydrolyzing) [Paludibacter sp.]